MITKYTYLTQDAFALQVWHNGAYNHFTINAATGQVSIGIDARLIGCIARPIRRVSEAPDALGHDCLMLLRETDNPQVWAEVDGRKYLGRPSLTKPDTIDVDTGAGTASVNLQTLKWTFHGREWPTLEEAIGSLAAPTPPAPIEGALYVFGRVCPKIATEGRGNPAYDYGNGVHLMRRYNDADWGAWLLTTPSLRAPSAARRRACIAYGKGRTPEDAVRNLQTDLYTKASQLIPVGFE